MCGFKSCEHSAVFHIFTMTPCCSWLSHWYVGCSVLFIFVLFRLSFCPRGFLSQLRLTLCNDQSLMCPSWFEIKYIQQQLQQQYNNNVWFEIMWARTGNKAIWWDLVNFGALNSTHTKQFHLALFSYLGNNQGSWNPIFKIGALTHLFSWQDWGVSWHCLVCTCKLFIINNSLGGYLTQVPQNIPPLQQGEGITKLFSLSFCIYPLNENRRLATHHLDFRITPTSRYSNSSAWMLSYIDYSMWSMCAHALNCMAPLWFPIVFSLLGTVLHLCDGAIITSWSRLALLL